MRALAVARTDNAIFQRFHNSYSDRSGKTAIWLLELLTVDDVAALLMGVGVVENESAELGTLPRCGREPRDPNAHGLTCDWSHHLIRQRLHGQDRGESCDVTDANHPHLDRVAFGGRTDERQRTARREERISCWLVEPTKDLAARQADMFERRL